MWTVIPSTVPDATPIPLSSPTIQELPSASDEPASPVMLLALLKQFELQTRHDPALQRVGTLTKVLIKELEIALHTQSTTKKEGEITYV